MASVWVDINLYIIRRFVLFSCQINFYYTKNCIQYVAIINFLTIRQLEDHIDMSDKRYNGKCHCGAVVFEFQTKLEDPFQCNCSFCIRPGATVQKVNADKFKLLKGETSLSKYGNRNFSKHYFCKNCGINVFTRIYGEFEDSVGVNLACAESVNISALTPSIFDGATLL